MQSLALIQVYIPSVYLVSCPTKSSAPAEQSSLLAQPWLSKVMAKLPAEEQEAFKTKAPPALKFLQGKIKELQLCVLLMIGFVGLGRFRGTGQH